MSGCGRHVEGVGPSVRVATALIRSLVVKLSVGYMSRCDIESHFRGILEAIA